MFHVWRRRVCHDPLSQRYRHESGGFRRSWTLDFANWSMERARFWCLAQSLRYKLPMMNSEAHFYMGLSLDIPYSYTLWICSRWRTMIPKFPNRLGPGVVFWVCNLMASSSTSDSPKKMEPQSLARRCCSGCWCHCVNIAVGIGLVLTPIACLPIFYNVFMYFYCIQTSQRN